MNFKVTLFLLCTLLILSACGVDTAALTPLVEEVQETAQKAVENVENAVSQGEDSAPAEGAQPDSNTANQSDVSPAKVAPETAPSGNEEAVMCTIEIDRSAVPDLLFNEVTLLIEVGDDVPAKVMAGGSPVAYVQNGPELMLTTDQPTIQIEFEEADWNANLCQVAVAPLKENKAWAWSIGFDDNAGLQTTIAGMQALNYRGTLFIIGKSFEAERDEDWIIDEPAMQPLLEQGWALGSHGFESACYLGDDQAEAYEADFVQGEERLLAAIERSSLPEFKMLAFAAPCFDTNYDPVLAELIANDQTEVRLNESGNSFIQQIGGEEAIPFPEEIDQGDVPRFNVKEDFIIGRDVEIEWEPDNIIKKVDWIAASAQGDTRLWYNSLAHGGNEENVLRVARYISDTYDVNGDGSVWVDTSTNIYSYLVTREYVKINVTVASNQ